MSMRVCLRVCANLSVCLSLLEIENCSPVSLIMYPIPSPSGTTADQVHFRVMQSTKSIWTFGGTDLDQTRTV